MPAGHRTYHRFSTFTPDQLSFLNYLSHHQYTLTLKTFQDQLNSRLQQEGASMANFIDRHHTISSKQFTLWLEELRRGFYGGELDWLRVEFMLLVWMCSRGGDRLEPESVDRLKVFIEGHGVRLSECVEILPYFALPYIRQPWHHPFLSKIYTQEWKQEIKDMIFRYCSMKIRNRDEAKGALAAGESQWLKVVKDLIDICSYFDAECQAKSKKHVQLFQRVKKYQQVIEENDGSMLILDQSMKPSQLSRIVYKPENNVSEHLFAKSDRSIGSVNSQDPTYPALSYQAVKTTLRKSKQSKPQNQQQVAMLFYALHQRILQTKSTEGRRIIIQQYVQQDILMIGQDQPHPELTNQIQCLKLMNTMCYCNQFVEYLSKSQPIINQLAQTIDKSKKYYTNIDHFDRGIDSSLQAMEQRLFLCFALLQKLSFRKEAYDRIKQTNIAEILVFDYLAHYQLLSNDIMYYIFALLLNILLRHQGKIRCSGLRIQAPTTSDRKSKHRTLFDLMVQIWKFIGNDRAENINTIQQDQQSQLYSFIYSIFYVLLTLNANKKTARSINFIQQIEKFAQGSADQSYRGIIAHMREILEKPEDKQAQDEQEIDNGDDDLANIDEVDQQDKEQVWIGDRWAKLQPRFVGNAELALQKYYQVSVKKKLHEQLHIQFVEQPQSSKRQRNPARISIKTDSRSKNQLREKKTNTQKQQNNKVNKNLSQHQKVQGYDPNKYQVWKRMRTSNH